MGTEIQLQKLQYIQCFMCNGWTPPEHMREVMFDATTQKICTSCYRKLRARQAQLVLESQKLREEEELGSNESEVASAFGSPGPEEAGRTGVDIDLENSQGDFGTEGDQHLDVHQNDDQDAGRSP